MSRPNDAGASYDRTLLSNIPDPTRAEKQEGYNIDLLDEGRDRTRAATNPPDGQVRATDGYSPGAVAIARKEGQLENGSRYAKKAPWYRTTWGITAIVIIIILIIGGAVGGAVGGTQHSSSHNSNGPSSTNSSSHSVTSSVPTGASLGGAPVSSTPNSPGETSFPTTIVPGETSLTPSSFTTAASTTSSPGNQVPQGLPPTSSRTTTTL